MPPKEMATWRTSASVAPGASSAKAELVCRPGSTVWSRHRSGLSVMVFQFARSTGTAPAARELEEALDADLRALQDAALKVSQARDLCCPEATVKASLEDGLQMRDANQARSSLIGNSLEDPTKAPPPVLSGRC